MNDEDRQTPLARLFAIAYRDLVDGLHARLRERGWTDVRPAFGFALLAARDGPTSVTELAALMGMTKQAASKLAAAMIDAGYLVTAAGADDGRVRPLRLSARGRRLLATVEQIYAELEAEWADAIGAGALERLRRDLTRAILASHGGDMPAVRPTL
ncbi:MAG TPA: MarR family winged helix-turn-helix transcriptional regulator [Acidimicrobiia bacterium]